MAALPYLDERMAKQKTQLRRPSSLSEQSLPELFVYKCDGAAKVRADSASPPQSTDMHAGRDTPAHTNYYWLEITASGLPQST